MSHVIERVDFQFVDERIVGRTCNKCGCGYDGKRFAYEAPCDNASCDGTQYPQDEVYTRRIPGYAIVKCDCGRRVQCTHHWLNTCDGCGRDYSSTGQALSPRMEWGEETGEHWADVVRPDEDYDPGH
jgi:hypothetical protein